jgi:predicted extracellular nuclease
MRTSFFLLLLAASFFASGQDRVILTGLLDGTGPGAKPRAIELYLDGGGDLEGYTIERYTNGGTESNATITLSGNGSFPGGYLYVVNGTTEFQEAFGTDGDFINIIGSSSVTGTGNDVFTLVRDGQIIDQVGGAIGAGDNLYQDSYYYRQSGTGPDGDWVAGNWETPGLNVLDNLTLSELGAAVPFGTYQPGTRMPTVRAVAGSNLAEPDGDGGFRIVLSEAATEETTVSYNFDGTATVTVDFEDAGAGAGAVVIAAGSTEAAVPLTVLDDDFIEGTETITLNVIGVSGSQFVLGNSATIELADDDLGDDIIGIHTVQGRTDQSPLAGNFVTVEAVVTADFPELGGYYIQEEDEEVDNDSLTSEGIFVFGELFDVSVGDLVRVNAPVEEAFQQTQLNADAFGATVTIEATGQDLPSLREFGLPRPDSLLEALESMRVRPTGIVVTDLDNLYRFGEVGVTSGQRLVQFTECNLPDAAGLAAYRDSLEHDLLIIDDARGGQRQLPVRLPTGDTLSADNPLRAGQRIEGLIGVLGYGFDRFRVQPTDFSGVSLSGNPRPTAAPEVGSDLTVVSANVLNYFTTLGERGADTEMELRRQEDKIVAALCELGADIVGLIEIENKPEALRRLVDTLNARCDRSYAIVDTPDTGEDRIRVALIYNSERVEESGTAAALTEPAGVFQGPGTNRVPLAQTFRVTDTMSTSVGADVTVVVNHYKSKGSGCGAGDDADDGSGNCDGTRTAASEAILDWLATDPTATGDDDILVIGDLNAYRMEAPIQTFIDAGYVNTQVQQNDAFPCGGGPPSYVFQGQWGSLDYALASSALSQHITGATAWTVNAPEPEALDYNDNEDGVANLYARDFYRFSDHDPIVVGIDFDVMNSITSRKPTRPDVELQRIGPTTYALVGALEQATYVLMDTSGRLLQQDRLSGERSRVELADYPAGLYFVVVRQRGGGQAVFRVRSF